MTFRSPRVALAYARLGSLVPIFVISGLLALVPFHTCVWRFIFGVPCPACGFTRASLRLLHGDLWGSFRFHPLAIPGAVGFVVALALALTLPEAHPAWARFERAVLRVGAVGFMVVWVLRLTGVLPPV